MVSFENKGYMLPCNKSMDFIITLPGLRALPFSCSSIWGLWSDAFSVLEGALDETPNVRKLMMESKASV